MSLPKSEKELLEEISRLKKLNANLEDSLNDLKKQHHIMLNNSHFLSSSAFEIAQMSENTHIYEFCADKIKKLLPHSTVMVASYNEKNGTFVLASIRGLNSQANQIMQNFMGNNFMTARSDFKNLPEKEKISIFRQKLVENPGGLYSATAKVIPDKLCSMAKELFGITGIYGIGLAWNDKLYGAVGIFSRGDDVVLKRDMVETMVSMISVALEQRKDRDQIKQSLQEKELLMKEIHHRTKNNLIMISNLLDIQSQHIKDTKTRAIFKEGEDRANSMALIHEKLYQSQDLKRIDFGEYLTALCLNLFRSYVSQQSIKLNLNIENIMLDIDTAIPLGLITNELITNCIKHAFPNNGEGEITLDFHSSHETLTLMVKDNGIGLSDEMDFINSSSMGLMLVNVLNSQIDGDLKINNQQGLEVKIRFKEGFYEK